MKFVLTRTYNNLICQKTFRETCSATLTNFKILDMQSQKRANFKFGKGCQDQVPGRLSRWKAESLRDQVLRRLIPKQTKFWEDSVLGVNLPHLFFHSLMPECICLIAIKTWPIQQEKIQFSFRTNTLAQQLEMENK